MLIPLGTDRPLHRVTIVNHALISLNLIAWGGCIVAKSLGEPTFDQVKAHFGLYWVPSEPWRFLTYTLLHDNWWHILGNMLFLWVFGAAVEDRLGRLGYLALYIVGAVTAGAAHIAVSAHPVIGASGAIAAVSGAFLIFFPRTHVRTLVLLFFFGIFNIPAAWFISFAIARDFLLMPGAGDNVARAAHLGGYGAGALIALALLLFRVVPRESFDALSLFKHSQRRREIRAAVEESQARVRAPAAKAADNPILDSIAEDRAAVSLRLAAQDLPGAMDAYRALLHRHARTPGAASLSRRHQLDVANAFFHARDYPTAMAAYERFLDAYPRDPEIPHIKLLMGLIAARYLHQPDRARTLITDARSSLHDEEQRTLAQQLLTDLKGGQPA